MRTSRGSRVALNTWISLATWSVAPMGRSGPRSPAEHRPLWGENGLWSRAQTLRRDWAVPDDEHRPLWAENGLWLPPDEERKASDDPDEERTASDQRHRPWWEQNGLWSPWWGGNGLWWRVQTINEERTASDHPDEERTASDHRHRPWSKDNGLWTLVQTLTRRERPLLTSTDTDEESAHEHRPVWGEQPLITALRVPNSTHTHTPRTHRVQVGTKLVSYIPQLMRTMTDASGLSTYGCLKNHTIPGLPRLLLPPPPPPTPRPVTSSHGKIR